MKVEKLSPEDLFTELKVQRDKSILIDVRSEKEFASGAIPYSLNGPILDNEARHSVGWTYTQVGSQRAFDRAKDIVEPVKNQLVQSWLKHWDGDLRRKGFVTCWRGGSRSRYACDWLREVGANVLQVAGGFKAVRRLSLELYKDYPKFLVVGGMTGSGKTELLKSIKNPFLDLEGFARHRGSAFGPQFNQIQPSQLSFELLIALFFWKYTGTVIIEDESKTIGSLRLPDGLYESMSKSPSIIIERSAQERSQIIYREYIGEEIESGVDSSRIHQQALSSLEKIKRKLGGAKFSNIKKKLDLAFDTCDVTGEAHQVWIRDLLEHYYDPLYLYSLAQKKRPILFQGEVKACRQWLDEYLIGAGENEWNRLS